MLIEDDPTMMGLLTTLLELDGYQVLSVQEGEHPAEAILREVPDLVLLDVNLRGLSGLDVLRQVRAEESLKDVRVLMSSGMDYRDVCLEAGADGFLLKPFMPDDLMTRVKELAS
jgi:DNA-binding response OmpR family regulator